MLVQPTEGAGPTPGQTGAWLAEPTARMCRSGPCGEERGQGSLGRGDGCRCRAARSSGERADVKSELG